MNAGRAPRAYTFTEAGGHAVNEDAFAVRIHPGDEAGLLCAVADGVGGQPGGGPAARLAVRAALDAMAASAPTDAVRVADVAVAADAEAGFTTLVAFEVRGGRVRGASNGDSALWLRHAAGEVDLTAHQRKNPPVGAGGAAGVRFEATLQEPWTLVAMTDGVWKYVGWGRIKDAAGRLRGRELIDELVNLARLPGSSGLQDDFTAIVVHDR